MIVPLANGEPVGLLDVLERHRRLERVRVHQMHALHERPYIRGEFGDRLRHVSYFLSHADAGGVLGRGLRSRSQPLLRDAAAARDSAPRPLVLAAASPPDAHGHFSLGTNADYVAALIGRVPFFLEANAQMPRTFGHNQIHISQVVGWCEADRPLVDVPPAAPDERDRAIAARSSSGCPTARRCRSASAASPTRCSKCCATTASWGSTPSCSRTGSSTSWSAA